MRKTLLVLAAGVAALTASAVAAKVGHFSRLPAGAIASNPFTEADLEKLLAKNPATGRPVDSINELVPLLPRELRSNFTFVYDSRSPFRSSISPDRPRVILFSNDGRLVLTYTGDASQPGADLLETMSFDDKASKFELHAFLLPAAERRDWRPTPEAANCASCHGADARPIFDAYPLWPGFYGSVLDTFPRDRAGLAEEKEYEAFLAATAKTEPYRSLIFRPGSPVSPYLDPSRFRENVSQFGPQAFPFMPSARLGMALTDLNRARIYRKLSEGKDFKGHEKQLLAELLECGQSPGPSPRTIASVKDQLLRENADRLKRLGLRPGDPRPNRDDMEELNNIRSVAEIEDVAARAGADRSDWSMAFEPGSLAFYDGILSGIYGRKSYRLKEDLIFELLLHLAENEPAFRPYFLEESLLAEFGYPFGNRIDLGLALTSCRLLTGG
ncbi:MAG: hypothetical protein JO273_21050 [Methylobacteriaceae bacterium]|nr:hypothetical protein [Methylobacteriaceae bacterium]